MAPTLYNDRLLLEQVEALVNILPHQVFERLAATFGDYLDSVYMRLPEADKARQYLEGQMAKSGQLRSLPDHAVIEDPSQEGLAMLAMDIFQGLAEQATVPGEEV